MKKGLYHFNWTSHRGCSHICFFRQSLELLAGSWDSWLPKFKTHCDIIREVQAYPAFPWAEIALGISDPPHWENSDSYAEVTSRKPLMWKLIKSHLLTFLYILKTGCYIEASNCLKATGLKTTFLHLAGQRGKPQWTNHHI